MEEKKKSKKQRDALKQQVHLLSQQVEREKKVCIAYIFIYFKVKSIIFLFYYYYFFIDLVSVWKRVML